ncbi:MAG TPA: DUF3105 domain-containing protein [Actinomycetota bacterium]|nr:DUF3105 domain-containing protein [Actinomycetota bacterium]
MTDKKKERREAARRKRVEEQRRRQKALRRKKLIRYGALGAVALVIVSFTGFQVYRSKVQVGRDLKAAGCSSIEKKPIMTSTPHLQQDEPAIEYNSSPPTSGRHLSATAPWGSLDEAIEDKLLIHNLEHGGIVIHHKGLPDEQETELEEFVDAFPSSNGGVISQPNPKIDKPVAYASWGRLQTCDEFKLSVARNFVKKNCSKGPEQTGLACTGP